MPDKKTLTLNDVSPIEASFAYWTLGAAEREKEWFRWAWQAIIKAGLAEYRTKLERCQVAIRCLALRYIYEDFIHLAQGNWLEPYFRDDAEVLGIKAFHLGVLLKEEDWVYVEDITDTDEFYDCALRELTDKERSRIHKILCKEFETGQYTSSDLFVSLWRIARQKSEDEVSDEEILNNIVDSEYSDAFSFVVMDDFSCERWYSVY